MSAAERLRSPPDLVNALHEGLKLEREIQEAKERNYNPHALHASDLGAAYGHLCARQLWLRLYGAKGSKKSRGVDLMWDHGRQLERRAVKLLRRGLGDDFHIWRRNLDLTDSMPGGIEGELDIEIRHKPTGSIIIADIKTVRGGAFRYLKAPKPANVLQVQSYMLARDADLGALLYMDREGQNFARQFTVPRDDAVVVRGVDLLKEIAAREAPPRRMLPIVAVRENKRDADAVYCKQPWQCDWCEYLDVSCQGALSKDLRRILKKGKRWNIVGRLSKNRHEYGAVLAAENVALHEWIEEQLHAGQTEKEGGDEERSEDD